MRGVSIELLPDRRLALDWARIAPAPAGSGAP
jgi:hypothetical protein